MFKKKRRQGLRVAAAVTASVLLLNAWPLSAPRVQGAQGDSFDFSTYSSLKDLDENLKMGILNSNGQNVTVNGGANVDMKITMQQSGLNIEIPVKLTATFTTVSNADKTAHVTADVDGSVVIPAQGPQTIKGHLDTYTVLEGKEPVVYSVWQDQSDGSQTKQYSVHRNTEDEDLDPADIEELKKQILSGDFVKYKVRDEKDNTVNAVVVIPVKRFLNFVKSFGDQVDSDEFKQAEEGIAEIEKAGGYQELVLPFSLSLDKSNNRITAFSFDAKELIEKLLPQAVAYLAASELKNFSFAANVAACEIKTNSIQYRDSAEPVTVPAEVLEQTKSVRDTAANAATSAAS